MAGDRPTRAVVVGTVTPSDPATARPTACPISARHRSPPAHRRHAWILTDFAAAAAARRRLSATADYAGAYAAPATLPPPQRAIFALPDMLAMPPEFAADSAIRFRHAEPRC